MKFASKIIIIFAAVLQLAGCSSPNAIMCTEEFRSIEISVIGAPLEQYYTIRNSTGDTIRINNYHNFTPENYVVLDDSYQQKIQGKTESFTFKGFIGNVLVVNETFVIKADLCHISKVSGKSTVEL